MLNDKEIIDSMEIKTKGFWCWFAKNINKVTAMNIGKNILYVNTNKWNNLPDTKKRSIILHEGVHWQQAVRDGRFIFYLKYAFGAKNSYRYFYEKEAYVKQMVYYINDNNININYHYVKKWISDIADAIATNLSGPKYLWCVNKDKAKEAIENDILLNAK